MTARAPLLALLLTFGCGGSEAPAPAPAPEAAAPEAAAEVAPEAAPAAPQGHPPATEAEQAAAAKAKAAMKTLGETLKGELMGKMQDGGPVAALEVCSTRASAMTVQVAEEQGVQVGRSSLRLRNPGNAGPDWVTAWLDEQGERKAEGVEPRALVVEGPEGPVVRVVSPLAVAAPCLNCHGPQEGLAPAVQEAIAARYPMDRATGYAEGDLRGAIWGEAKID